ASLNGIWSRFGVPHVSPELYMGTRIKVRNGSGAPGLIRGVTRNAPLVRRGVQLIDGQWPQSGQVMAGRLAAAKLGVPSESMAVGRTIEFEGKAWTISGEF